MDENHHQYADGKEHFEERMERDLFTYWYAVPSEVAGSPIGFEEYHPCPTVLWAAKDRRYAWIDLTAGPISYGVFAFSVWNTSADNVPEGPHTSGNGLVSDFSIPNLENFKLEDEDEKERGVHEDVCDTLK